MENSLLVPDPNEMKLPEGKSCGDCQHKRRCINLFAGKETNITCGFSPSKFKDKNDESKNQFHLS